MSRKSLIIIAVAAVLAVVVGGAVVLAASGTQDQPVADYNAKFLVGDGYTTTSGTVVTAEPGKEYVVATYTVKALCKLTGVGGVRDCTIEVEKDGVTTRYSALANDTARFWGMQHTVDMEAGAVHSFAVVFCIPDGALDGGSIRLCFGQNIRTALDTSLPVTAWTPYKPA